MKRIIYFLLPALLLMSCTKNAEKAAKEFQDEATRIFETLQETEDEAEAEQLFESYLSLVNDYLLRYASTEQGIEVLRENYYLLSVEQLDAIFAKMKPATLEDEKVAPVYAKFQMLKRTEEGTPYTDFSAPTPDDQTLALSEVVGKSDYVLVDFWASWCGPCRRSMPEMKALYDKLGGKLQIVGVSLDQDKDQWVNAIQTLGLNWLHMSDLQGWQSAPAELYGISAIPATVLINKEGIIIGRNLEASEIEALLKE